MIAGCDNCLALINELKNREENSFRKSALEQLSISLCNSSRILHTKRTKVDSSNHGSQHTPAHVKGEKGNEHWQTKRRAVIEDTIIQQGNISFRDVAGLAEAKETLREAIVMPIEYPQLFTGGLKPWKRVLLYGPPGTGKSRLAQAVSSEIHSTFYCVSSADLISSWVGESEKIIRELFQHAIQQTGRSVIFIDEIDSICRSRSSSEEEHTRRVKTELLRQMEGADNAAAVEKIFLLCATNRPWELDSAFLRRFQKRIYIPLPDSNARRDILKIHTKSSGIKFSEGELQLFAASTEGYSGSDLSNLILSAMYEPVREVQKATHWFETEDGLFTPCSSSALNAIEKSLTGLPPDLVRPRQLTIEDFLKALSSCHSTISHAELDRFTEFTEKYGHCG
ncbi:uncharacterized protein [Diadema setosum]